MAEASAKYVIVRSMGFQEAIVFGPRLSHAKTVPMGPAISAGFYGNGKVWGHSESLGRESRPEDAMHIERMLAGEPPLSCSAVIDSDPFPALP